MFRLTLINAAILRKDQCGEPSGGACRVRVKTRAPSAGVSLMGCWPGCTEPGLTMPSRLKRRFQREMVEAGPWSCPEAPVAATLVQQQYDVHPLSHAGRQVPLTHVDLEFAS